MEINLENIMILINNKSLEKIFINEFELLANYNEETRLLLVFKTTKNELPYINDILNKDNVNISIKYNNIDIFKGLVIETIYEENLSNNLIIRLQATDICYYNLSKNKYNRMFQDLDMNYKNIIEDILKEYKIEYHISKTFFKNIGHIFYQYEESDWEFLKRLASDINQPIIINDKGVILFGCEALGSEKIYEH